MDAELGVAGLVDLSDIALADLFTLDDSVIAHALRRMVAEATDGGDDDVAAFNSSI